MKNNYVIINSFLLRFFTGDMQLIAEIYDVLKELAGLDNPQMADVFAEWNKGMHLAIFLLVYLCWSGLRIYWQREKEKLLEACFETFTLFCCKPQFSTLCLLVSQMNESLKFDTLIYSIIKLSISLCAAELESFLIEITVTILRKKDDLPEVDEEGKNSDVDHR